MNLAKRDDDPDRVRLPQRGNDERRIGQEKNSFDQYNKRITTSGANPIKQFKPLAGVK